MDVPAAVKEGSDEDESKSESTHNMTLQNPKPEDAALRNLSLD
jgi:hypothetical protein